MRLRIALTTTLFLAVVGICDMGRMIARNAAPHAARQDSYVESRSSLRSDLRDAYFVQCGSWPQRYAGLHANMMSDKQPGRFAVGLTPMRGLSDALIGFVHIFMWALLDGRSFQLDVTLFPLHHVYESPYIDWVRRKQVPEAAYDKCNAVNPPHFMGSVGDGTAFVASVVDNYTVSPILQKNFSVATANHTDVYICTNLGWTVQAFGQSSSVARELENMGLTDQTAFGCLFKYLFWPKFDWLHSLGIPTHLLHPGNLKIGIQVRAGDESAWMPERDSSNGVERFQPWFDCAKQIEDTRRKGDQPVLWYLISDSVSLRDRARNAFAPKLITANITTGHTAHPGGNMHLQHMVAEQWVFSLMDYKVITEMSGVGRTAAFLTPTVENTIYTIRNVANTNLTRACGPGDADDFRLVASEWSHV